MGSRMWVAGWTREIVALTGTAALFSGCTALPLAVMPPTPSSTEQDAEELQAADPSPIRADAEVDPSDLIIDPGAPHFSQSGFWASSAWWESTSTDGYYGHAYLVAPTDEVSDPAQYWWEEAQPGCRRIDAWWTEGENRSARVTYVLTDERGLERDRRVVDQTRGGAQWMPLFEVNLPAGKAVVLLSRWDAPGLHVVADALRVRDCTEASTDLEPDPLVEPWIEFVSPVVDAAVGNPVEFVLTGENVESIRLSSDGWEMARWDVAISGWQTRYSFSETGRARTVLAEAFSEAGERVASAERTIFPRASSDLRVDVPYYYQYDNTYEPAATCGLTSTAMVLEYWTGRGLSPDDLYERYGKRQAQSPSGIASLMSWEGLETEWSLTGTRAELRAWLDSGRAVVVHGDWTRSGHIAVLVGYDADDWIVHDPAGDWEVCYGCGGGSAVRYSRTGSWDDRLSWDGDIWYSVADIRPL